MINIKTFILISLWPLKFIKDFQGDFHYTAEENIAALFQDEKIINIVPNIFIKDKLNFLIPMVTYNHI